MIPPGLLGELEVECDDNIVSMSSILLSADSVTIQSSGPTAQRFPHLLGRYYRDSSAGTLVYRKTAAREEREKFNTSSYYIYYSGMSDIIITILGSVSMLRTTWLLAGGS